MYIINKRPDGYHNLETVFYPVPLYDVLEVVKGTGNGTRVKIITEGLPVPGNSYDNLIVKAYHLLDADFNLEPVTFCLLKKIPMGAGLGGGSGNAAFALKLLNQLFELGLDLDRLRNYASQLGSDCSFFIANTPAIATGRGELLKDISLNLSPYHIVLVIPPVHVSTPGAFSKVIPRMQSHDTYPLVHAVQLPVEEWNRVLVNDFETSVFSIHPELQRIKDRLYEAGAVYASMSGSGSAIYGLFKSRPTLENSFPGCSYFISD